MAVLVWTLDSATKIWAVATIDPGERIGVIGSVLTLVLVRNPGAAFSTGESFTLVLSVVAIVAVGVGLWLMRRVRTSGWAIALGLLVGGVSGNLTDRLLRQPGVLRGHVVDFLALPHWPVFNVADMCINAAAVLLVVQSLRGVRLDGERVSPDSGRTSRKGGKG